MHHARTMRDCAPIRVAKRRNSMRPKRIVALSVPIFLAISIAQDTHRVEMREGRNAGPAV